ncbi:Uncharacterized membrane protein [Rhizobiales bacterium GAS113]|jgi:uncharacterized membrane protein|nr:Uncharacterized membrane protein [Rhizobiales bacterium GAS113]SEE46897.1 Uncharacterized membrane protein [Rhizobiales bacterium GAS188]
MSTGADETVFEAKLTPHRSLGRNGFRLMMTLCCISAVFSSIPFILFGAWPVAGFYGLDVLAVFVAFKVNYRRAGAEESVRLTYVELVLSKITHRGETAVWRFNPLWARLSLEDDEDFGAQRLSVVSGRQSVSIGDFLAPPQRRDLAVALGAALTKAKRGPDLG